jgi:hypothetical protein
MEEMTAIDPKSALQQIQALAANGLEYVAPPPPVPPPVFNFQTALRNVGFKGKLATHVMPWVGEPGHIHRENAYSSNNIATVRAQLDNMQAVGIEVVLLTWRGIDANGGWDQSVATLFAQELATRGMKFAYVLDPNLLMYRKDKTISVTQELIRQLSSTSVQAILNSSAYVPERYVLDFLTGFHGNADPNQNVDWVHVCGAINVKDLIRNEGYAWPSLQAITDVANVHKNPAMRIPGVAYRFNDAGCPVPYGIKDATKITGRDYTQSVWQSIDYRTDPTKSQPARINQAKAGHYYLDCVASIAASPVALSSPYVAIVTWNDYDEGTAIEDFVVGLTGIRIG